MSTCHVSQLTEPRQNIQAHDRLDEAIDMVLNYRHLNDWQVVAIAGRLVAAYAQDMQRTQVCPQERDS